MSFLWPEMLWLLLAVPAFALVYVWVLRRRKRTALRFASLSIVRGAVGSAGRIRRHLPPALFLAALALMIASIARPAAVVTLPTQHDTVILAIDVSGSMRATDVEPNRLVAAQEAARAFVAEQPRSTRIGIVQFAGTASLVQPPTNSKEDLLAAIDRFQLQRATAIGSGILVSLKAVFPQSEFEVRSASPRRESGRPQSRDARRDLPLDSHRAVPPPATTPAVAPGSYDSALIILLTDGQTTTGPDPIDAARLAAERGVRVFTVGIGTTDGEIIGFEGWSMRVRLDEDTLKAIASMTRGEYFYAGTATDLKRVYQGLNARFVLERKQTEVTALFSAAAALLAALGGLLSLLWFNRIV